MIKRFSFTLLFCQMIGLPYALADTQAEQDQALQNQSVQSQSVQSQESQTQAVQEVEDVIPITMANIEGQKHLYQEGWYIISSSAKAFEYAKKHSVDLSFQAIEKASQRIALRSEQYTSDLNQALDEGQNTHNAVLESGTERTQSLINKAQKAAQSQRIYSKNKAAEAWQALISGYVYLGQSSQESLNKIKGLPGNYVDNLSQDHQQMWQSVKRFHEENNPNILAQWDNALEQAETEFEQAYLDSGHKGNSLTGLWRLMTGYVSGAYKGVVKPTLDSSWQVTKYSANIAGEAVFLPLSSSYILTKNTVQSAGLAFYYSGKTAIEVISPTLKGGYLASLSIISSGAAPITYLSGTSLGMVNQVGTYLAAPVAGASKTVQKTASDTLTYGALVTYDAFKGSTKVFVNQMKSGVVLGYNALTALPSQLFLTSVNSAVFLAWDGPKLTLAAINGDIRYQGKMLSPGSIPVGSVIDLKAIQAENPDKIQVLSEDPNLINRVLDQLTKDLSL